MQRSLRSVGRLAHEHISLSLSLSLSPHFAVTITSQNFNQATRQIVDKGGVRALWTGSKSRTVEGALIGAVFMLGSVTTKAQLRRLGAPPTVCALAGGLVGGVAQAAIMTPGACVRV